MQGLRRHITRRRLVWLGLFGVTWALSQYSFQIYKALDARWIIRFPSRFQLNLDSAISGFLDWLVNTANFWLFTFRDLTRAIAWVIELPYQFLRNLLIEGFQSGLGQEAVQIAPSLSWIAVIALAVAIGHYARDWGLAALVGACFLYLAVFGQWHSAMITLASVLVAVPIGAAGGLALGILAYRSAWVERLLRPVLDLMQTVPVFAYLVPILILFGFGPVAALVATVIYAMPPMIRVTIMALKGVPEELLEAGRMMGATPRQMTWKVLVPAATPMLMVGVNQVIMLTLNMVIIASMIGAGGLGFDVLASLRKLDIGGGIEAGLAIVVMAIALDRASQAFAERRMTHRRHGSVLQRHPRSAIVLGVIVATFLLGQVIPAVQSYPDAWKISTGPFWSDAMAWINVNFFDTLEAIKTALLKAVLLPVKKFFAGIPWLWGILAAGVIAWRVAGWKMGIVAALMMGFIAASGLWGEAMVTLYLCGVSVFIAVLIGTPLGIWAAQRPGAGRIILGLMDTLQTLPSFVYLIPVVMLFRVGDFSAMIAVVLYALAPAVRYAAHGIREVPPHLLEAGRMAGCTPRQLLWRVKLPLAVPQLLLGLNQTIMLALSMLVITALVGTRDLGQEVYIALTKANAGQGIVAGLSVAFIAIIADRIVHALSDNQKRRLGL
ncbi:glycine betaine/L-proline transport system permease protein ProW [Roseovarius sp. A-2]|uniref:ABC transporter permease n=1 Tax=Roseovarius sp. A-2 TaxID=1570360 RepID=UPI0009B567CD|nr:ABC transporter permease subunit [Roseovarius sp. A-2]GAW34761.1 glycine betaine/L-proline transport system permease protein ProW [Roseovarius sp. A-2]